MAGPNVIDDCEGMTEEEYYRGMDEAMKCKIETTDVDVEATAWAIATLDALHVDCMSTDNAAMMDRLRKMTGA